MTIPISYQFLSEAALTPAERRQRKADKSLSKIVFKRIKSETKEYKNQIKQLRPAVVQQSYAGQQQEENIRATQRSIQARYRLANFAAYERAIRLQHNVFLSFNQQPAFYPTATQLVAGFAAFREFMIVGNFNFLNELMSACFEKLRQSEVDSHGQVCNAKQVLYSHALVLAAHWSTLSLAANFVARLSRADLANIVEGINTVLESDVYKSYTKMNFLVTLLLCIGELFGSKTCTKKLAERSRRTEVARNFHSLWYDKPGRDYALPEITDMHELVPTSSRGESTGRARSASLSA